MIRAVLTTVLVGIALAGYSQHEVYVSTTGSDRNPGSRAKPFATLHKAQQAVRSRHGTVIVWLRGGTYYLAKPLVFGPEDARKPSEAVTYQAYPNEKVRISGGVPLRLNWQQGADGMQRAKVRPGVLFDQLFVNGDLQRMARYPNYTPTAQFFGGTRADAISPDRVSRWTDPTGGYVHALHKHEWGDFHYRITGKDSQGQLQLEGGFQNNRRMGMHDTHRFVENIAQELDTLNEWYFDKASQTLAFLPAPGVDLTTALVETPQIRHLFEFRGTAKTPVTNITLAGFELTQTLRTFMDNKEPLLRSDWTTYRGGAVLLEGAEHCRVVDCYFNTVGGNAVYFSNYNRNNEVSGCRIVKAGASGVSFVGDPNAVRSPSFEYNDFVPLAQLDRTPGPKSNNYPAQCRVYNTLMHDLGQVEKQSAGVQISMSQDITVSHNTLYDLPRAGINIGEGTWGGHVIEYNDVFNTVLETGDHGSFNSWGRDRFWHPNKKTLDSIVATQRELVRLDVVKPIIIHDNRFRCDHGWDIDLDDGSSNYHIYNNLCLNGGIKLREGCFRTVENNIMVNNSFHPHVWFTNSDDVFRRNIVTTGYFPIQVTSWGRETDQNVFLDCASLTRQQQAGHDLRSVCAPADFVDPAAGDYRLRDGSPAFATGFKNFPMDRFGVVSPTLRSLAKPVPLPQLIILASGETDKPQEFMGMTIKNLTTLGERSATGMASETGVLVLDVLPQSLLYEQVRPNDVILACNRRPVANVRDLQEARMSAQIGRDFNLVLFRNQQKQTVRVLLK